MRREHRWVRAIAAAAIAGCALAATAADEELSLRDLITVIDRVNQDLPKQMDNEVVIERAVQGWGRQMIIIYTVPLSSLDLTQKDRAAMRAKIQTNLCTSFEKFTRDNIAVSARMFSKDKRQIIGVTANKASCAKT